MNYQVRSAGIRRQFSGENALLAAIRYARNLAQAASVHRLEPASNKLGYNSYLVGSYNMARSEQAHGWPVEERMVA